MNINNWLKSKKNTEIKFAIKANSSNNILLCVKFNIIKIENYWNINIKVSEKG